MFFSGETQSSVYSGRTNLSLGMPKGREQLLENQRLRIQSKSEMIPPKRQTFIHNQLRLPSSKVGKTHRHVGATFSLLLCHLENEKVIVPIEIANKFG